MNAKRIFLSYGHDGYAELARRIKADLEARGLEVWFDENRLVAGADWEAHVDDGLAWIAGSAAGGCVVLLMTPHSVRRPEGYCLNEIARAISRRLDIVPVMVVNCEPPLSICRIQWLDMQSCWPVDAFPGRYGAQFDRLVEAISSGRLDFEGSQSLLLRTLEPLSFDADLAVHLNRFAGRRWIIARVDAWLADRTAVRLLWITGGPGVGKTALASWLCANRREVAAFHLCAYNDDRKRDPRRCVLSIAYQLSTQLPEYLDRLARLDLQSLVRESSAATLFDQLVVSPLWGSFPDPGRTVVVLIDSLDEATKGGHNDLATLLAGQLDKTPEWLRFLVTSRAEPEVTQQLQAFDPIEIKVDSAENETDLREFIAHSLPSHGSGLQVPDQVADAIIARSEGSFLYVEKVREEVALGRLSIDRIDEFPRGLGGIYTSFFKRQFPDGADYQRRIAPAIEMLAASSEPLPVQVLAAALDWSAYDLHEFQQAVGSLFPEAESRIRPFHRSITEWLTTKTRAFGFWVDVAKGHRRLASLGLEVGIDATGPVAEYFRHYLPEHLIALGRWDELVLVLADVLALEAAQRDGRRYEWMRFWQAVRDRFDPGPAYTASLERFDTGGAEPLRVAHMAVLCGGFLREMGHHTSARPFLERALRLRVAHLTEDHPDVAESLNSLAELLRAERDYEAALPLYQRALAIRERANGRNHRSVASSLHDMGELWHDQQLRSKALYYYGQALEIRERVLPASHPEIADCLNDMGAAQKEDGRHDDALPLFRRALDIYQRAYGRQHIDVAAVEHNIAQILQARDSTSEEAADRYLRALSILERTFPPHHAKVIHCRGSVDSMLAAFGKSPAAVDLRRRILRDRERTYGASHVETRTTHDDFVSFLESAAWAAGAQGDHPRSIDLARQLVAQRESIEGADPAGLAGGLNVLARLLQESGDDATAIPIARRVLAIRNSLAAATAEELSTSHNNLGLSLVRLGLFPEAESQLLRAIEIRRSNPYPQYWLARLYRQRAAPGDLDREVTAWFRYLELGGTTLQRIDEAKARLAAIAPDTSR